MSTILYTGRMPHSCLSARTWSALRSVNVAIISSPKPRRFAAHSRSGVSASDSRRRSIFAILPNARVNQGSIPVARDRSSGATPLRSAAISAHNRSSFGWIGRVLSRSPPFHERSSHSSERLVISSDLTAFWNAASKERSMAMTSPVAFICVPISRSPRGNLSKGQRGILTTQ